MTMEQILRAVKQERGMSALRNGETLVGLFLDFSRNQLRPQANALKVFVSCQGNTRILNLQNATVHEQQVQFHRLVQEMITEHNMREETAAEVCSAFWRVSIGTAVPVSVGEPVPSTKAAFPVAKPQAVESGMTAEEMYQRGMAHWINHGDKRTDLQRWREAVPWFQKAAELNHVEAQKQLGFMFELRWIEGITADPVKSAFWFGKAAEQGDAAAQVALARHYRDGEGVEQNYERAIYWCHKAAEQNYTFAMGELRYIYGYRLNNPQLALDWCKKAAELGSAECQWRLGTMYEEGFGTDADYEKALYWYRKAAEQGDKSAAERIPKIEKKLKVPQNAAPSDSPSFPPGHPETYSHKQEKEHHILPQSEGLI